MVKTYFRTKCYSLRSDNPFLSITDYNACASRPCHPLVWCRDYPAPSIGYQCGPCPSTHYGNGVHCRPMCPFSCPYGMRCIGPNSCGCREGYYGIGCKIPFCPSGCFNGGTCVRPKVCKCPAGFGGRACLQQKCDPPCRHNGVCVGRNRCRCPTGFVGPRCQTMMCMIRCLNRGVCTGPYTCRCKRGYTGVRCERGTVVICVKNTSF